MPSCGSLARAQPNSHIRALATWFTSTSCARGCHRAVRAEIHKDYVKMPVDEIEKMLTDWTNRLHVGPLQILRHFDSLSLWIWPFRRALPEPTIGLQVAADNIQSGDQLGPQREATINLRASSANRSGRPRLNWLPPGGSITIPEVASTHARCSRTALMRNPLEAMQPSDRREPVVLRTSKRSHLAGGRSR